MDASTATSAWAVLAARWLPCFLPAAIKAGVLLGLVWAAARATRRASAALRHLVWTMGIGVALLLPLLEAGLSPWQIPLPESLGRMLPAMTRPSPEAAAGGGLVDGGMVAKILLPAPSARPDPYRSSSWLSSTRSSSGNLPATDVLAPPRSPSALARGCLLVWLAGICALLAFRVSGLLSLRTLRRTAEPLTEDGWPELLRELAGSMKLRRVPDLVCSRGASTPMTWGIRRPLILLPPECRCWSEEERVQVLVHELAHVRRRDCLTSGLVQAACVVHWFNPLAWVAARQVRLERERACDDRVLDAGIRPSLYAEVLLRIARRISPRDGAAWAVPAMARRSQLYARLDSVLDPRRRRGVPGGRRTLALGLCAAAVLLSFSLIGPSRSAGSIGERRASSRTRWSAGTPLHSLSLTIEGDIRFNEDASAIDSMAAGSSLILEERNAFHRTRVEAHPGADGKPVYAWKSGLRRKAFDDEARRWLAEKLPAAFRDMAIDVEPRVRRLYATGGATAVLADLDKADSDYARRQLLAVYFRLETLTEADVVEGIRRAAAINSDYDRAELLLPLGTRPLASDAGASAWLQAMDAFGSDFDRFRVLTGVQKAAVSPKEETLLLRAARTGNSDYERARFLETVPAAALEEEPVRSAFFDAFARIHSAFDARQVLASLADDPRSGREVLHEVIAAVSRLDSDFDRAEVLVRVAPRIGADPQLRADGLKAAEGIHSDFDYARVTRALLAGG